MRSAKAHSILLVEDQENDVFFVERAFKQAQIGNPLFRVRDGEEAISYLTGEGEYADRTKWPLPDLVLLDLKMPRKDGFEVITWVREQRGPIRRLPIVVLTSSKEDPDVNRAYELGANTYLMKPVKFDGLVEMMKVLNLYWLILAEKPDCSG
ncbi:MAG TPA: response regulator [Verrucomicrobiae bacterium]|nr:response regulator [Verrucomicrobiae bacterium]